jgi:hypothetical protein
MNTITRQWLLWIIALTGAFVGAWACFAPVSWYDSFPGLGFRWLPPLGPYNEHLSRDVGALYLALTALSVGAALRPANEYLVRLTGVVWLVFSVPHLIFHLLHLDMYGPLDQVLNVVSLGLFVVIGAALVLPTRAARRATGPLSRAGGGSG